MLAQFIPVSAQVPMGPRPVKLQVPEGETELPAVIRRNPSFPESGAYSERPKLRGKRGTPETILPRKKRKIKDFVFCPAHKNSRLGMATSPRRDSRPSVTLTAKAVEEALAPWFFCAQHQELEAVWFLVFYVFLLLLDVDVF